MTNFFSPCKDCPDRKVGCHGSCEKYARAKAAYAEKAEEVFKVKRTYDDFDDYKIDAVIKARERSRRKR